MKEAPEIDDSRGFQNFLLILVRGRLVLDLPIDGTDDKHPAHRPFYSHSMVKNCVQFVAVCLSLSHLHPVSKMVANPWGQIWVTDFGAGQGGFVGHGGSRFAPGSNGERIMLSLIHISEPTIH